MRHFQPARAAAVIVLSAGVGIAVLARMGGTPLVAATTTSTTARVTSTTRGATTSTTTVPVTTTSTLPAATVTVLVLNGGTTYHAALYFQTKLHGVGYDTLAPNNALTSTNRLSEIFVVKASARNNALAIAKLVKASPSSVVAPTSANDTAVPPSLLNSADLILLVGSDISTQVPANFNTTSSVATTVATTAALTTTTTAALTTTTAAGTSG